MSNYTELILSNNSNVTVTDLLLSVGDDLLNDTFVGNKVATAAINLNDNATSVIVGNSYDADDSVIIGSSTIATTIAATIGQVVTSIFNSNNDSGNIVSDIIATNATLSANNNNDNYNWPEYCEPLAINSTLAEIDQDEDVLFHFVTYGILLNSIGVFGIFGNIISMIILSRPQMKSSINYLLIGLARCDTVLIITSMLLFGLPSIYSGTGYLFVYYYRIYPLIAPIIYPIGMISQTISVYLTLTVTLERFVAVCHPLRARSLCTCGRARFYVVLIIVFSILYNITRFWEVTVRECVHNQYNVLIYRVHPSNLRNNHLYISIYIHWMYLVFMYFIPFSFLAILNTAIYRQVRRANQERQRLSRLQKKEIGLATMLLCVVVVFLICNAMALVSNVLEAFYGKTIDCLVETGNLMVTINSSVNFVIYVIFGEKFKRLFLKLFFPHGFRICGNGRDSPEHTREDSFISFNGEFRGSGHHHCASMTANGGRQMHRVNTSLIRNGRTTGQQQHNKRNNKTFNSSRLPKASSPGPGVYYPRRESSRGSWDQTSTTNF